MALEGSEELATRFLASIAARFDEILGFPRMGAPRPRLARELRVIFKGVYAIYYLPLEGEVVIVRVLHGSRDLDAIAVEGGFAV